jgi:hypothetical protein
MRETILCPVCGGSGRVPDLSQSTNAWITCYGCWGKGWIEVLPWLQEKRTSMRFYFPVRLEIKVRDVGGGDAELEYTEWYEGIPEDVIRATIEFLQAILPKATITKNPDGSITMKITTSRDSIYSGLAMEFLGNSPLGRLSLTELLVLLTMAKTLWG